MVVEVTAFRFLEDFCVNCKGERQVCMRKLVYLNEANVGSQIGCNGDAFTCIDVAFNDRASTLKLLNTAQNTIVSAQTHT